MQDNYTYPLMADWSREETIDVLNFYQLVETAYEDNQGVNRKDFLNAYRQFTQIVPSKMEQKQLERQFKQESSYDTYEVFKAAKNAETTFVKL